MTNQKRHLVKIIRFSNLPLLIKNLYQKKLVTVIYYHNIDPVSFDLQVNYLIKHYNIISIGDLSDYLNNKRASLPPWSLLITFDDGHAANYKLLDIFRKYNIKPTIFLTANLIGSDRPFWFSLPFKSSKEKDQLKLVTDDERLEYLKGNYANELSTPVKQSLSWDEVKEMADDVDFHSHTLEHPCLPQCTLEVMSREVVHSKSVIEEKIQRNVFAIAYPNGDFTVRELDAVKSAGYKLGFTTKPGFVSKKSNPFAISRFSMNDTVDINDFILRITGTWFLLRKIISFLRPSWKTKVN